MGVVVVGADGFRNASIVFCKIATVVRRDTSSGLRIFLLRSDQRTERYRRHTAPASKAYLLATGTMTTFRLDVVQSTL